MKTNKFHLIFFASLYSILCCSFSPCGLLCSLLLCVWDEVWWSRVWRWRIWGERERWSPKKSVCANNSLLLIHVLDSVWLQLTEAAHFCCVFVLSAQREAHRYGSSSIAILYSTDFCPRRELSTLLIEFQCTRSQELSPIRLSRSITSLSVVHYTPITIGSLWMTKMRLRRVRCSSRGLHVVVRWKNWKNTKYWTECRRKTIRRREKKLSKQLAHFQLSARNSGVHAAVKSPIMSLLWSCTANVNILKLKTNSVVRHLSTAERTHRIPSRQIIVNHCTQQDKTTSRKGKVRWNG